MKQLYLLLFLCTFLTFFSSKSNSSFIDLKINSSKPMNRHLNEDEKILLKATLKGDIETVEALLLKGVDVNIKTEDGSTLLHLVSSKPIPEHISSSSVLEHLSYIGLVAMFISNGVDVNVKNNENITPLHFAAERGEIGVIKILLKLGAYANAIDAKGFKPYDWAFRNNHKEAMVAIASATNTDEYDCKKSFKNGSGGGT